MSKVDYGKSIHTMDKKCFLGRFKAIDSVDFIRVHNMVKFLSWALFTNFRRMDGGGRDL